MFKHLPNIRLVGSYIFLIMSNSDEHVTAVQTRTKRDLRSLFQINRINCL